MRRHGLLAAVLIAAGACTPAAAPDDTVSVRSAVNSNVVVTVLDGAGVPQVDVEVYAKKNNGSIQTTAFTNASGQATLSLPANSYRFLVEEAGEEFYSGAVGHCVTPACTTASITITRVDVTVVDTSGAPQSGQEVWWKTPGGVAGGYVETGANGHALIAVPAGSYRFELIKNGYEFASGASGHCTVPTCTAVTITTTIPVAVTVQDVTGAPQAGLEVIFVSTSAEEGGWIDTNASGVAMVTAPQGAHHFKAYVGDEEFVSGAAGHCVIPGCTSATITVSQPVSVTVADTTGTPITGKTVYWLKADGNGGVGANTNASGVATVVPPLGETVRFKVTVDGTAFYSGPAVHCSQPGCTTATITVSAPTVVTVVDGSGAPVSGKAVNPFSVEGVTSANKTTNASGQATFRLPLAHWRFRARCTGTNEPFWSGEAGHCGTSEGCVTAKIKMPCGQCTGQSNGTACDDQSPCTGTSTCQSQFCSGGSPMGCSASDECHVAGACGAETGTCSNPPKPDGASCTGGTCQAGVCSNACGGGCPPPDQCHLSGTCNPATGTCTYPPKLDGDSCNDGDACTQVDECQAGGCVGYEPVVCAPSDTCHGVGVCNPATGICSNPTEACPPTVQAGTDVSVQLPAAATLAGSIAQDPPQGTLSAFWTQVSGPGLAQFANASSAQTTATFTAPGTYTLRLIGGDGEGSATDDVVVTVQPPVNNGVATGGSAPTPGESFISVERTAAGYISLRNQPSGFHFIWLAVSSKGTIVKLDTETGQILGEYFTSPAGVPRNPSRTTVDHNGNVWTANRDNNSVVHVGLRENGQCVDRNGNGVIDTSQGQDDIKAWTNTDGADTAGGVTTAADECILHYTRVRSGATRHITVDANNDVWVSGWPGESTDWPRYYDLIDGQTGHVKREEPGIGYGGYGGLIDPNGVIWSARPMLRWDPSKPLTGGPQGPNWRGYSHESYGLCIDPQGNVWNTWFYSSEIRKFNPAGDQVATFGHGRDLAQGCVVGGNGHVWVAHSHSRDTVGHLRADGTHIGNVTVALGPTGLAVDAAGKLWVTAYHGQVVQRIDPNAGPLGSDGVTHVGAVDFTSPPLGGIPYNYSDMTGSTLIGMPPTGTWSFVWDSAQEGAEWGKIGWTAAITGNGALTVRAASSADGVAFGTPVVVRRGEDFDVPNGRYLRVTVSFKRSSTGESPLLYDLTIGTAAFALPAQVNHAPAVNAGPDRSLTLPYPLTVSGTVQDDGLLVGALDATWIDLDTGPLPVSFTTPNATKTDVWFAAPGVYALRLFASDLALSASDDIQVVVSDAPPLAEATFVVTRAPAGPLSIGSTVIVTASLVDGSAQPMPQYPIVFEVGGANPTQVTLLTDNDGFARLQYVGKTIGIDNVTVKALGLASSLEETLPPFEWQPPGGVPITLTQNWIGAPLTNTAISGRAEVKLAAGVTLLSGVLDYWPHRNPSDVRVLDDTVSGGPGTVLATLDTTMLANDSYVIRLTGVDNQGQQQTSLVLAIVTGDYKPGRVVVEVTDLKIDLPGLPLTIGRRYDSLEKDIVGDFGHGWSLAIGHPRLEVNPNFGVSVTLPGGRRTTFDLTLDQLTIDWVGGPTVLPWLVGIYTPTYRGEPGVFGKLTAEGACPLVRYNPANVTNPLTCFFASALFPGYAPEQYVYTDPYGTAYTMALTGELRSIKDRQGNTLTFTPGGIISSAGKTVTFSRDAEGRIDKVIAPAAGVGQDPVEYHYGYDGSGDLVSVELPPTNGTVITHHTYENHRLETTVDPRGGNPARTSTYFPDGRLETDTDAEGNETSYAYDLETRTTTTTFEDTGVLTQVFDTQGMLLSETDPLGHTTTHGYDANRNETSRIAALNELNETMTATYDPFGNQRTVTIHTTPPATRETKYNALNLPYEFKDALGHITTIKYDERGLPTEFADELGTQPRYTFTSSDQGLPTTVKDAAGKVAQLKYDDAGNVLSRTDFLGRVTQSTYDELGRLLTQTSPRGGVETRTYHPRGTVHVVTDALGGTRTYTYDKNDNLVEEVVAGPPGSGFASRTTTHTYNALNQLTQTIYPDTRTVSYTRDFRGNPLTMIDEAVRTTTYEYDKAGHLKKTIFPDTTVPSTKFTTRTYDPLGRLATVTDERNNTTTYGYQAGCGCSDRVTTVTDPLLRTTTTGYDALGRRTSVTDANNHTTTFEYDVRGHLTDTHYPDTKSTHEVYDARGRRTSMTDQMTKTTLYGYDDQGQLTSVTDPMGNVTSYGYDLDGNLESVTDANHQVTTYEYDLLKRKTKRKLPLGQFETFVYDAVGNQTGHTDFRGKITAMAYDARDRILAKTPDPSLSETAHGYTYTPSGMRLTSTDATGTTSYTYDPRDRLLTKATAAGMLTYTYDPAGNLATIRSSNTNGTSVDYLWDAANQLVSITDNRVGGGTGATIATYTDTRRPFTVSQPNGIGVTYSYDSLDRVTSMLWRQGTSPAFASWAYGHNDRGQRTSSTDVTGRIADYGYDDGARLTSENVTRDPRGPSHNGAIAYLLDGAGNRMSRTSTLPAIASAVHEYDANDQLASDGHDANGNTTSSGGNTFAYDFENRLVSKNNDAVTVTYDCDGNRVAKTVGGVTTRYLVDGLNPTRYAQVLEEVFGGGVQTRYTYGTHLVSQTRGVSATPVTSYYGFDAHGNVTFLTDAAGAVTDSYDYDAWGLLIAVSGATPNMRLYAGEEFDPDLGFLNLRARQYTANGGRFLSVDPAAGRPLAPASFNTYLYANGDPVNRRDPSGRVALVEAAQDYQKDASIFLQHFTVQVGRSPVLITAQAGAVGVGAGAGAAAGAATSLGLYGVLGLKTACNLWIVASAFEMIDAGQNGRKMVPPPAPFEECTVDPAEPCELLPPEQQDRPDLCQYRCPGEPRPWNIPSHGFEDCPDKMDKEDILNWPM